MTRNRSRRNPHINVEAVESRCLLSATDPLAGLEPIPARTASAFDPSTATVTSHDEIINASAARLQFGVTGAGLTAAVIDTGVDYDHPAFGGGFGSGGVVKAGYDFGDNDADPREKAGSAHGTAVAGIIASREPTAPGVAPGAEIAALRVFGDSGKGSFDGIADALQWVITHHEEHKISVVNLSISDGKNYQTAPTLFASPVVQRIDKLIDQLEALRIPVVTAAGNSFTGQQGMGFTAIVDNTISVTGSDGTSRLAPDAQRLGKEAGGKYATDLAAPGRGVTGPWVGSSFAQLDGTSFAAPLVTGSVLLLQELYLGRFGELPTVDQVEGWLRDSARPMRDPATGFTIGRLDVAAAAAKVPSPAVVPTTPARPTPPPRPTPPVVVPPSRPISRPSTPVAEPPANAGGSDRPSTPPVGSDSPPKAPEQTPPPSDSGNDNSSSYGNDDTESPAPPQSAPVSPPATPEPSPAPSPVVEPPSSPDPAPAPIEETPPAAPEPNTPAPPPDRGGGG